MEKGRPVAEATSIMIEDHVEDVGWPHTIDGAVSAEIIRWQGTKNRRRLHISERRPRGACRRS
jgi:hypothetical protein